MSSLYSDDVNLPTMPPIEKYVVRNKQGHIYHEPPDGSAEELEKCHELLYSLKDAQKEYPKQSDAYVQFVFAEEEDESVH